MSRNKHYIAQAVQIEGERRTVKPFPIHSSLPPRSYLVAFQKKYMGNTLDSFMGTIRKLCDEEHKHIHGLVVLHEDWFVMREPFKSPAQIIGTKGNSLLTLYQAILGHSHTFLMYPADMTKYVSGGA